MARHASDEEDANDSSPYISGALYRFLKFISLVLLPAGATFYAALAPVWNLPRVQDVVVSITSLDTFIGVIIGVSSIGTSNANRIDGSMKVIDQANGKKTYSLEATTDLDEMADQNTVTFKVHKRPSPR